MLFEMYSDAFRIDAGKETETIRPIIQFKDTLNIVNGTDTGTNSIGKSNFLMCVDFCFGGNDYFEKSKPLQRNVGDHEIKFAFKFNDVIHRFCRSTETPDIVIKCNSDYEKTEDKLSTSDFTKWLDAMYNNNTLLSFRSLVSLYLRIHNRDNLDENRPLKHFKNQTDEQSIENLIKLFNYYDEISDSAEAAKEAESKKKAFTDAQKYEYIPKITKTKKKQNETQIAELQLEKEQLAEKSEKGLLELSSTQAELISAIKQELSTYRRQRSRLYARLDAIKKDKPETRESLQNDFTALSAFFPSIDTTRLTEVEDFHRSIAKIISRQTKESEQKIWNLINLLSSQITDLEKKLEEVSQIRNVSRAVLEKYSLIDKQIESLKLENEKHDLLEALSADLKTKEEKVTLDIMKQARKIEEKMNSSMGKINSYIFGASVNKPEFHIENPKKYSFYTPDDDGTGTNNKGLVVMDLATLETTPLPILAHDSDLLKLISNESIEKIFELYIKSGKQIFIAIDKESSYTEKTKNIIKDYEVLRLAGDGQQLYGFDFSKKQGEK